MNSWFYNYNKKRLFVYFSVRDLSLITVRYPDDADGDQEVELKLIQFHLYSTKSHQSPLGALMTPALLMSPER